MLQQLGYGGKSIYNTAGYRCTSKSSGSGVHGGSCKLDRGVECLCHEEKKGYFCHLMKAY